MSKSLHEGIGISEWKKKRREHAVAIPSKLFILTFYVVFFPSRQTRALQAAAFSEGEFLIIITRGFYSERNKFRQSVIFD